jgi:hypothetical protein
VLVVLKAAGDREAGRQAREVREVEASRGEEGIQEVLRGRERDDVPRAAKHPDAPIVAVAEALEVPTTPKARARARDALEQLRQQALKGF